MEVDDIDINSSDIEYDAPSNPAWKVGKASIQAMIENAVSDRFESKKRAKQLSYVKEVKKTQVSTRSDSRPLHK